MLYIFFLYKLCIFCAKLTFWQYFFSFPRPLFCFCAYVHFPIVPRSSIFWLFCIWSLLEVPHIAPWFCLLFQSFFSITPIFFAHVAFIAHAWHVGGGIILTPHLIILVFNCNVIIFLECLLILYIWLAMFLLYIIDTPPFPFWLNLFSFPWISCLFYYYFHLYVHCFLLQQMY